MRICWVGGAGQLGWPLAAVTATQHDVVVADIDTAAVAAINAGTYSSPEPDVDRLVFGSRIEATTNVTQAAESADMVFVIVQTPSIGTGAFSLEHVLDACWQIGKGLSEWKTVVISSTVNPGDTDGSIKDSLETSSGLRGHQDFGLCYNPEFVRQGAIVEDFASPEYVVIGHTTEREAVELHEFHTSITLDMPTFRFMSLPSAEIAKIGLNTSITAKIARANELAWLCHRTPGANAEDVLNAIGTDPRISSLYLGAGPPAGGPCFPRDDGSLADALANAGLYPHVARGVGASRIYQVGLMSELVSKYPGRVGVLGLTYKPNVELIVESPGVALAKLLGALTYDPVAESSCNTLEQCVDSCDVLVIATRWPEFKRLERMDLSGKTVIDWWGFLDGDKLNCEYIQFGVGK